MRNGHRILPRPIQVNAKSYPRAGRVFERNRNAGSV